MDLFKIVGRLSIEGANQANNDILSVTGTAQKAKGIFDTTLGKIAGVVGTAVLAVKGKPKADKLLKEKKEYKRLHYNEEHRQKFKLKMLNLVLLLKI